MAVKDNSQIAKIEVERILNKIYKVLPNKSKGDFIAPMHLSLCIQNLSNVIPTMIENMSRDEFTEHLNSVIKLEFIVLLRIMDYSIEDISKNINNRNGGMFKAGDMFEDELLDITRTIITLD